MTDPLATGPPPTVLVVGNLPPIPTAGAAKTLELARELWAQGEEVETIAPRPCGARRILPIAGLLAGYRLANQQRASGARRVVIVAEPGLPVAAGPRSPFLPIVQWLTVRQLVAALGSFDRVTLVVCGHHNVPASLWRRVAAAADEVHDFPDLCGVDGVTARGPAGRKIDRSRLATSIVIRKIFGRHTPQVRAMVAVPVYAVRDRLAEARRKR